MNQTYAIDSTRISHREYWWGTKSPLVLIGWITKWLRIRIPSSTDDPNVETTQPWVVDSLPDEVMERFRPLATELANSGFYDVAYHCIRDPGTQTTIYWATFLHDSGTHFARIHHRVWGQSQKVSRAIFPIFFTEFTDGTFFVSSSGKPDMLTPNAVQMNRMPGAPTDKLWAAHQERSAAYATQRMPVRVASAEEALASTERHHLLLRDFNLARGVFRARTAEEETKANAAAATMAHAQASGLQHGEVLAELEALQQPKRNWGNAIWILVISIIAFVALGAARWDWKFTLWLIPVLLFHEAGHWLAMKIFGYRNLRMFFIPLFGAAVSGRHWNVPGWKKGIVSLAGPVPGIALGAVVTIVALIVKTPWLNELAFLLLILNGFNLLPVLPLDGGHLLHATLFCRNRWLDIVFRCLATGGLILLGIFLSKILLWLGVVLAIGLPVAFKLSKVVDAMRRTTLPPPLPGDDRIPPETAQAIITALKAEQPKGLSNKLFAQQTISVYETINARPPGVLATLGLLAVHGGAFFVSLVFCFILVLGKFGGGFGNFLSSSLRQPQHEVECQHPAQTWRGSEAASTEAMHNLLVATLPKRANAVDVYSNLTGRLPATAHLLLFGDSLLLSLPSDDDASRERWFRMLQTSDENTFVIVSNQPVTMSLFFIAPTESVATNLAQELAAFGAAPGARLIAPWSPQARTTGYTNYLQARMAWLRLNSITANVWSDPAMQSLNKRIAAATRRGATAEAARLAERRDRTLKDLAANQRSQVREEFAEASITELVDLHAKLDELDYTNQTGRAAVLMQVAAKLGEEASTDNPASEADDNHTSFMGAATSNGLIVEAPWCSFSDPQTTLPLLLNWLCEQRCTGIKYDFNQFGVYGGLGYWDEEEDY